MRCWWPTPSARSWAPCCWGAAGRRRLQSCVAPGCSLAVFFCQLPKINKHLRQTRKAGWVWSVFTFFLLPAQLDQPRPQGQDELVRRAAQKQQLPTPFGAARVERLLACFAILHGAHLEFLFLQHKREDGVLKLCFLEKNIYKLMSFLLCSPKAAWHNNLIKFYCWARFDWCWKRSNLEIVC